MYAKYMQNMNSTVMLHSLNFYIRNDIDSIIFSVARCSAQPRSAILEMTCHAFIRFARRKTCMANSRDCPADELMERANIIALEVLPNKSALPEEAVRGPNWQIDSKPIDSIARFWQNEQSSRKYATCTRSARKLLLAQLVQLKRFHQKLIF